MVKLVAAALMVAMMSPAWAQSPHTPKPEKPVDNGPATPGANNAYQGGGVVLQGAPGAPAPAPKPTASGQAPAGSVETLPPPSTNAPPSKAADD
jgi:hypothetical protein